MKAPIPPCPYKTKGGQCLKGWYMIPVLTSNNKIKWVCPECEKLVYQRIKKLLLWEKNNTKQEK